jgi:hypothetical protein
VKHWLKLADAVLIAAREEQERIKEQIRPAIENYRRIKYKSGAPF